MEYVAALIRSAIRPSSDLLLHIPFKAVFTSYTVRQGTWGIVFDISNFLWEPFKKLNTIFWCISEDYDQWLEKQGASQFDGEETGDWEEEEHGNDSVSKVVLS